VSNNKPFDKFASFDFASLYPTTMKDFSLDPKLMNELKRQKLLKERKEKLKQIKNLNEI